MKKKNQKRLALLVALAICVAAVVTVGTLAWFTDEGTVTNTFKFATDDNPGTDDFDIDLFETMDDGNGGTTEVDGLNFTDILPGSVLDKDPTVRNDGTLDAYVRVTVTLDKYEGWAAACAKYEISDLTEIFGGYVDADWTRVEAPTENEDGSITYTFYYNDVLVPEATATLFTSVTIPGDFSQEDVDGIGDFTLVIHADAIQAENTGDTAVEAFAFFPEEAATE